MTSIFARSQSRPVAIARNLSVLSFWIAITLVLILAAGILFEDVHAGSLRLFAVISALLVLIPVHMFRNLRIALALPMTLALWVSTGFLTMMVTA